MLAPVPLFIALAGPPGPTLEWSAPPGCPGAAQIEDQAAALVGTATLPRSGMSVRGGIHVEPAGFLLTLEIETPTGVTRKQASADDCRVLGSIAALMLAVAVDPIHAAATPSSSASHEPDAADPTPLESPDEPLRQAGMLVDPPTPSPRSATATGDGPTSVRREPRWIEGLLRAAGGVGHGLVPRVGGTLSLGGGVRTRTVRAEAIVFHVLAQEARYPTLPSVGAEVAAWGGSLRAGPAFDLEAIELSLMAGVSAAALTAQGFGVLVPRHKESAWTALCVVPTLRWRPASWWALGADAEVEAALRRPAFALDTLPEVYRAAPIGVRGMLVVEIRLGRQAGF